MARREDFSFGAVAEKMGLVDRQFVDVCLLIQSADKRAGHTPRALGEIMIEKGFLTKHQVDLVLQEQRRVAGAKIIGPYHLIKKLGEGGMGAVFMAKVRATGAQVALKTLPKKYCEDKSYIKRFQREAAVGLELDHPNIVRILTVGEDRGIHYMSMELVLGGDLKKAIKKHGRLGERLALNIIHKVAMALDHAHQKNVVHRDVKPSNIMFTRDGVVKLSDFGLVKSLSKQTSVLTRAGLAVGTPHYISPEQARGVNDVDIRADIFSLGATLYHLVTGKKPFMGANALEVMTKVVKGKKRPVIELNPRLSAGCVALINQMMATKRSDRYSSPALLVADMERVIADLGD